MKEQSTFLKLLHHRKLWYAVLPVSNSERPGTNEQRPHDLSGMEMPKTALFAILAILGGTSTGSAVTFMDENFGGPLTDNWNVTTGADGSITTTNARLHVDAADIQDRSIGTFGLISKIGVTRLPSGQGNLYVYFWGVEHVKAQPQQYYLCVTEDSTLPSSDNNMDWAVFARSSSADLQETYIRGAGSPAAVNFPLAIAAGGPLPQPGQLTKFDYRMVIKDQGMIDPDNTQIDLQYKPSNSQTWIDFVNSAEAGGTFDARFPNPAAPLYVAVVPREQAPPDGTDILIDAVQILSDDVVQPLVPVQEFFRDPFDGPLTNHWTVTTSADGTLSTADGRLHVDAADVANRGPGTFGLLSSTSFQRLPSGEGPVYVYFIGVDHAKIASQQYMLGITEQPTLPSSDNDMDWSLFASPSSDDLQELSIRNSDGIAVNFGASPPVAQPDPGLKYDFRIVIKDQGTTNPDTTQINLEYKLASTSTWSDFISTGDPVDARFPALNADLYVAVVPREQAGGAGGSGTDVFLDEVLVTTENLTFAGPGVTYYVATDGDDANPGTEALPFRTLSKGVTVVGPHDTLLVKNGTYTGSSELSGMRSGLSWDDPVTIKAFPGHRPVIVPTPDQHTVLFTGTQYVILDGFLIEAAGGIDGVKITWGSGNGPSHHIRVSNCEIRGAPNQGILVTGGQQGVCCNELVNLDVHNNGSLTLHHGIYLDSLSNLVDGCVIYSNAGYGVHIHGADLNNSHVVRNSVMFDNARIGFGGSGVIITDGADHEVYNNIVYGNNQGIWIYENSNVRIYNNTVYANEGKGISIGANSVGADVRNNIVYANTSSGIADLGTSTTLANNLVDVDPEFFDEANKNFRLTGNSPAIDTGTFVPLVTQDFDGIERPQGPIYDIGASEYGVVIHEVPLWWLEGTYGLGTTDDAALADQDGDGAATWQEWVAWTDPTEILSVFSLTDITPAGPGQFMVSWLSVEGKRYNLYRRDNIMSPAGPPVLSDVQATPPENTESIAVTDDQNYFRVEVAP